MVTIEQVAEIAEALPEVTVGERHGHRTWFVGKKSFAWERPLTKADIRRFGDVTPPDGPIVAISVEDMEDKEAVLAARHRGFFDMEHFRGYPAVLVQLRVAAPGVVRDTLVDGWLAVAPDRLAEAFLAARPRAIAPPRVPICAIPRRRPAGRVRIAQSARTHETPAEQGFRRVVGTGVDPVTYRFSGDRSAD